MSARTKRLGLTGNIACGKSTVLKLLADRGAEVVDADRTVHGLLGTPGPLVEAIGRRFGAAVVAPDGAVDRRALGAIVFRDPGALADLEGILYPVVLADIRALAEASTAPVFVVDAIKLIEAGLADECDQVWVVTCPRELQIERLVTTRGLTREEAIVRIDAQGPQADKVARADVVIDNGGTPAELLRQVDAAWARLTGDGR